jgi:hypothetical protein
VKKNILRSDLRMKENGEILDLRLNLFRNHYKKILIYIISQKLVCNIESLC